MLIEIIFIVNWVTKIGEDGSENYILCGNSSGAMKCSWNSTCLPNIGENPNNGYTSFDSYGFAMLSAFRLITQDYWENLYQLVILQKKINLTYFDLISFVDLKGSNR
jgi:voltage-gated sodium channel type II alpha